MNLSADALADAHVRLEPFTLALKPQVRLALDVDPESWAMFPQAAFAGHFEAWWAAMLARAQAGKAIPYAVRRRADDRVVGVTSFLEITPEHGRAEIGATFLHPDARGGVVNPAIKRRMLQHLFAAGAVRAELHVDARNLRSQAAVAKLGAGREGLLRRHKTTWTGFVRDTVMFSVTDLDWPQVRERLDARLAAYA